MGTDPALAEYMPVLYRAALDSIDELARSGARLEAAKLRKSASRAYARSWDGACRRTLEEAIQRAHLAAGTTPPVLAPPASLAPVG
jgi:hypothetical protein